MGRGPTEPPKQATFSPDVVLSSSYVFISPGTNYKNFYQIKEEKLGMGEKVSIMPKDR